MKKSKDYTLLALAIPFFTVVGFHLLLANSLQIKQPGHTCRWDKCPYKGVNQADFKDAIMWYTNAAPGSDAFAADSLHFVNPSLDYDQIDSTLFNH